MIMIDLIVVRAKTKQQCQQTKHKIVGIVGMLPFKHTDSVEIKLNNLNKLNESICYLTRFYVYSDYRKLKRYLFLWKKTYNYIIYL